MAAILDLHQNKFSFFYLHVILILPMKFLINWPFGVGKENRLDFRTERFLTFFYLEVTLMLPTKFQDQEKKLKIDFQDGHHGGQFRLPVGTILASFNLHSAPILPTMFRPFRSREEAQNRFSECHVDHLRFPIREVLCKSH